MKNVTNIFGNGNLFEPSDLKGTIYCQCCACMSISSDFLSWVNHPDNKNRKVVDPRLAENIIILSCQVTDLAILNDINYLENLIDLYPNTKFFVGGCLAKRFDIPLPDNCERIDDFRIDEQPIIDKQLINYSKPFWVKNFKENDDEFSDGHLFRNMYPFRTSVGCNGKCSYCTIKTTRGRYQGRYVYPEIREEFKSNDNIVLINDSISSVELYFYLNLAEEYNKQISLRNIEPRMLINSELLSIICKLADKKLIKIIHCPIQHTNENVLKDMNRTHDFVKILLDTTFPLLKYKGIFLATNIIIDYKDYPNPENLEIFDYVSWNPYWDGNWDIDKAKDRWNHYFNEYNFSIKDGKIFIETNKI